MSTARIVGGFLPHIRIDDAMEHVARVTAFDRYQASAGIERAAAYVAEAAHAIGLSDVSVERFPADGAPAWWSFRAPVAWTPIEARLEIREPGGEALTIDHAHRPFSIATYSAATPADGIDAPLVNLASSTGARSGAVVLIDRDAFATIDVQRTLLASGALGFITDAPQKDGEAGRIELDPGSPLFAFSVRPPELARIRSWSHARAHATIAIDRSASMPVVTGVIPGTVEGEVWLLAHLCHPRPGANDNASGVAALLGVAAAHRAFGRTGRTLRFIWGPEYLGTVAMLHRRGGAARPFAVINLDMVGEDQALCGGPFIVERNPDTQPSLINPIAEDVVREVFARLGGVGAWEAIPFMGYSDHALFATRGTATGAVQFCHPNDRFNHSAADTLDKVSAVEMRRSMTAAAALAHILGTDGALSTSATASIVSEWCLQESEAAVRAARQHRFVEQGRWSARLLASTRERNATMRALFGEEQEPAEVSNVAGRWSGPVNLRALIADAAPDVRSRVNDLIRADKRNYALLLNFAIRVDGTRTRDAIIDETSLAWRTPIDLAVAHQLFDVL
jgi:hypothetical protein